jgi:N-acetyl-gamma-glutamyl-phosphate reductase
VKKIGVVGATGYTGSELVRILLGHPDVELSVITSASHQGERFSEIHPSFRDIADHRLVSAGSVEEHDLDLVFLALPHGVSMAFVKDHWQAPFKIIDLSGDFRLSSEAVYEHWYGTPHTFAEGIDAAVYGLPEVNRQSIQEARLVANPGCYPTSVILATAPLVGAGVIDAHAMIVDSKSGVTGAGVKPKPTTHFSNVNDNFRAYGLKSHRHTVEMEEALAALSGSEVTVQFTPHLLPVDRGILSTIYLQPIRGVNENELIERFREFYSEEPFVRIRSFPPSIKDVRGSNLCDIHATFDDRTGRIIVVSVIDNLVKGAAGQAVHNMNLMFDIEETCGLTATPLRP